MVVPHKLLQLQRVLDDFLELAGDNFVVVELVVAILKVVPNKLVHKVVVAHVNSGLVEDVVLEVLLGSLLSRDAHLSESQTRNEHFFSQQLRHYDLFSLVNGLSEGFKSH